MSTIKILKLFSVRVTFFLSLVLLLPLFQNCSRGFFTVVDNGSGSFLSSAPSNLSMNALRRLSNLEYKNSISDGLSYQFLKQGNTTSANIIMNSDAVVGSISELPVDAPQSRLGSDQIPTAISTARFSAYTDISHAISQVIVQDSPTLMAFAGTCATSNNLTDSNCSKAFINSFGLILYRAPIQAFEVDELLAGVSTWQELIGRMLLHPRFLVHFYREGIKSTPIPNLYQLTAYEIEAKMTSLFWKSIPDQIGLNAAASGALSTPDGLKTEIARVLNSQKAKDVLWLFYQEWLGSSRLPFEYDTSLGFELFADPLPFATQPLLKFTLRDAVFQDAKDFLDYHTWTNDSNLEALFRSPLIFTTDSTLASLYGVRPRVSEPVADLSGHYKGILTRAFITQQKPSVDGNTNPIQRGVFLMTNILGQNLGQPANFAEQQMNVGSIPLTASTREETVIKTAPINCMSCHSRINPSGFALSHFDSLGRYITTENRYTSAGGARLLASNPVDSTTSLYLDGINYNISDVSSLVDALVQSEKLYEGFARYYFKFAFGHVEGSPEDEAYIANIKSALKTKSIRATLESIPLQPDFGQVLAPN